MGGVTMLGVEDGIMLSSGRQDKAWPRTYGAKAGRRLSRTAAGLSKIPRSDSKGVTELRTSTIHDQDTIDIGHFTRHQVKPDRDELYSIISTIQYHFRILPFQAVSRTSNALLRGGGLTAAGNLRWVALSRRV